MHPRSIRAVVPAGLLPRLALLSPVDLLAAVVGVALPLAAALLYRTYDLMVHPEGWEMTRQLGLPFVAAEIGFLLYARRRGLDLGAMLRRWPRGLRGALIVFLATFWVGSAFVSPRPTVSLAFTLVWLVHLLFAAAVFHLVRRAGGIDPWRFGFWLSAGVAALVPVIAAHFLILPPELIGHERSIDWGSAVPGFISSRLFGAWVGAVAAFLLGLIWLSERGARRAPWLYPAFALIALLMMWSGTRAALLGCGVAMIGGWIVARPPPVRALTLKVLPILAVAALLAIPLAPWGHPQFYMVMPGDGSSVAGFTSGRTVFWASALRVFAQHPLFGTGAASSWWLVPLDGFYHVQPHNAVVQFLLNWGVFATLAALVLLSAATWRAHIAARANAALLPMVMLLDCLLAMSMVDGMLHFARFVLLIALAIATCLATPPADARAEA